MSFSIQCFEANPAGQIVSVDWKYTNADGTLSNTHVLATPAGDFALAAVTQGTLIGWIEDQLSNTAAEFDTYLAAEKARKETEAAYVKYEIEADETYAVADAEASAY